MTALFHTLTKSLFTVIHSYDDVYYELLARFLNKLYVMLITLDPNLDHFSGIKFTSICLLNSFRVRIFVIVGLNWLHS
jgi:hypothetical protein